MRQSLPFTAFPGLHRGRATGYNYTMFSIRFLHELIRSEIARIAPRLDSRLTILELGAGTREQALQLSRMGFSVTAIDVNRSHYALSRQFDIIDYDGVTIPLPNDSVDIVYSSDTLEHIKDLTNAHSEIKRVLRQDGHCIHVQPTHAGSSGAFFLPTLTPSSRSGWQPLPLCLYRSPTRN